jgi:hypothetical protein
MSRPRVGLWGLLRAALALQLIVAASASADIQTALPPPGNIPYSWGIFGNDGSRSPYTVNGYFTTAGAANGPIYTLNTPVLDIDPDKNEAGLVNGRENIGNLNFQYALWQGTRMNPAGTAVGAALFGGFNRTDLTDVNGNFAFLQIFRDNANPNWRVDGGGWFGKTNGTVSNLYNQNPGWNYAGTQYDYLDRPFDRVGTDPQETVSFETALVNYNPSFNGRRTEVILADFTWSFTWSQDPTTKAITLTGTAPTSQAAASATLINLYTMNNAPGLQGPPAQTLQNIGQGSCHAIDPAPEPASLTLIGIGALGCVGFARLRRKQAA